MHEAWPVRLGFTTNLLVSPTQIPAIMAAKISLACRQLSCRWGQKSNHLIMNGIAKRCMVVCPGRPVDALHQMLEVKGGWPLRSQIWLSVVGLHVRGVGSAAPTAA